MGDWLALLTQVGHWEFWLLRHPQAFWLLAFGMGTAASLIAWLWALRRHAHIADTPTSRIVSAAQGYVELVGAGRVLDGVPTVTPHLGLPCLWYHYTLERRERDAWRRISTHESDAPFLLDDGSGVCELDPAGAQVVSHHVETRVEGDYRHTEKVIHVGETIYALGEFRTTSGADASLNRSMAVGELLGEWKQDRAGLHERFDLNGDGEIQEREWQLARLAAGREVERRHQEARRRPPRHTLSRPAGGRTWLIATSTPERLARRFLWQARLYLALLVASLIGLGWAWGGA